jgi:hypothetical protein
LPLSVFDECKALNARPVNFYYFCEHAERPYPQAPIAIQRPIYDMVLFGFAMLGDVNDLVEFVLIVLVYPCLYAHGGSLILHLSDV